MTKRRAARTQNPDIRRADVATDRDRFPIVGIGASAGGLDAFSKLLDELPGDSGMAFVLVQHLDPTHASMMVDLLSIHTKMAVLQATNRMPIECDHVYVIPPGVNLSIDADTICLSEQRERHGARRPFDFFLQTLAEQCGKRAICAILSGTGDDGSRGLQAIVDKGGLVIAQDPEEAAYDGMPRSAIMTGAVDLVLPVTEMAAALVKYGKQPYIRTSRQDSKGNGHLSGGLDKIIFHCISRTKHFYIG